MSNQQKDTQATTQGAPTRSDTTAAAGAQPVQGRSASGKTGAQIVGGAGGTDAAAGASMGGDGGSGLRGQGREGAGAPGSPGGNVEGNIGPGAGAAVAGGTGLGEANSADDTRTGISSGEGASLTDGDPSSGAIPPPASKGGASAA
ncbi:hypothetical protein [Massilia phyllosphaerae]|uniref:hypothetical protein n=1 Tax=Massilia phyllosphaerae TaxID=3106034 RepID=UPI002B1CD1F8|nr:hypothetical protein [Massilia sp. SGZ-792]